MRVLKVELEGTTTSFRYPHFLVGRQPSMPLPPPATIYGHIASALGEFPDPAELQFGYCFTYAGRSDDLETQHIVSVSTGKIDKKWGYIKNLEGSINPSNREVLLFPKLTLYIKSDNLDFYEARFRQPRYAVVLGRSQDLATYTGVTQIDLVESVSGYFEGTLLSNSFRKERTNAGSLMQMPRFINPENRQEVDWEMYLVIEKPVFTSDAPNDKRSSQKVWSGDISFLVDPDAGLVKKNQSRIVTFHSFMG
ncbi:CRISPR-associated protein Cas5 [Candidatus Chlorohelix sp.]|uniref:CRISPR-associated protein Cas5 n=1 Tax=Candidatus Chlorohelix sp. TaxID=3139201 RepID=UPI0030260A80